MLSVHDLPAVNACLNALSTLLLTTGFAAIRRKNVALHKKCMSSAVVTSALFLVSYLVHKCVAGHTAFSGQGAIRVVYFSILLSHTTLAVVIVPLVITTLLFALRDRIERHRKLARITLPLWLYVSVTGVVVYFLLYHWPR